MKDNQPFNMPYLPDDIPFNGEQKQWLSGFLSGLHSRLLINQQQGSVSQASSQPALKPLTVLYGTQTGNSQAVAEDIASRAGSHQLQANVLDMEDVTVDTLRESERLLIVTSTYGEGEMPDNAQALWDAVSASDAPALDKTYYSVLALGDTNYDGFCVAGIEWDKRLAELGAERVADRVDCDVDYEKDADQWIANALPIIAGKGSQIGTEGVTQTAPASKKVKYNLQNPCKAKLLKKYAVTETESSKQIVHYEFCLDEYGQTYEAGDAINIIPVNHLPLVNQLLAQLDVQQEQAVIYKDSPTTAQQLLSEKLEIRTPSTALLSHIADRYADSELAQLVNAGDASADQLSDYLWGRDILDLITEFPLQGIQFEDFITLCKPMAARAYSISSSIEYHPNQVHLTVGSVRYTQQDREHLGVCSTYLADRLEVADDVLCYFAPNKKFSVPENHDANMIMVGPGTGIAPFRGFLQQREISQATGENWLFFGDRNSQTDYIYQDEIEAFCANGTLAKLDLAFSRDQAEKIYVQDRMAESAEALYQWLEDGAYFYVCGDAHRMAKDVERTLLSIIAEQGGYSAAEAEQYLDKLKVEKRYVRDVY